LGAARFEFLFRHQPVIQFPSRCAAAFQKNPMGVRADVFRRDGRTAGELRLLAGVFGFMCFV
jgi:hypothetical protein